MKRHALSIMIISLVMFSCNAHVLVQEQADDATSSSANWFIPKVPDGGAGKTGVTEPFVDPKLQIEHIGPVPGQVSMGESETFYSLKLQALDHVLWIHKLRFQFQGFQGPDNGPAKIQSDTGPYYFTNFQLVDTAPQPSVLGLVTIPSIIDEQYHIDLVFDPSLELTPWVTRELMLMIQIADMEYVPGEFIGNAYTVSLRPFELGDVEDLDSNEDLPLKAIDPNTPQNGHAQIIVP